MKQLTFSLCITLILSSFSPTLAGGWGPVYALELRGEAFAEPLIITDPSIVEELSFWVGPGTGYSVFMGPVNHDLSIVDWDRGEVTARPSELPSYEVRFLLEPRIDPPKFIVTYEPDPENGSGYIYYPSKTNSIVTHMVDGTWRYASTRWNERVGAAIAAHLQSTSIQ